METNKLKLYIFVGVLAIVSIIFRVINEIHYEQESILFVGLPALITVLVIKFTKPSTSLFGFVFKIITLFLLLSSILFGEGIVCILFAAPIFYGTAAVIIFIYEYSKKRDKNKLNVFITLPVIILLLQPLGIKSEKEVQKVTVTTKLNHSVSVLDFGKEPDFNIDYPSLFKIGFPQPVSIKGKGLEVGDIRNIKFKSNTKGIGILSLKVVNVSQNKINFDIIKDETHIAHWLTWKSISVHIDEHTSEVTWETKYTCDLGPEWYFEPLEKIAVEVMNEHLIHSYFNQ